MKQPAPSGQGEPGEVEAIEDSLDELVRAAFEARRSPAGRPSSLFDSLSGIEAESVRVRLSRPPTQGERRPVDPSSSELPPEADERGRYEIAGELARGGIGVVLRARDTELGRDVAMKLLRTDRAHDARALRRFLEEAQIGGQLEHPGVVPVHDVGVSGDGRPFFTMKLVEGRTLAELLRSRTSLDADRPELISIFERICQTLAFAHARGVVHRDLKPANVIVGRYGEVVVVDWGLAQVEPASETKAVMGTPAYMPPEQARGESKGIDARSDVFSLGAILCEILSGSPPYSGDSPADVLDRAAACDLQEVHERLLRSDADPELASIAVRCLASEAEHRPHDAGELARLIQEYTAAVEERMRGLRVAAEVATAKEREAVRRAAAEKRARRLTIALGSTALAVVLLAGGATFFLRNQRIAERERLLGEVNSALIESERSRGEARASGGVSSPGWQQARLAAERAHALVASRGDLPGLRGRVEALLDELRSEEEALRAGEDLERRERVLLEELGAAFEGGRSWVDVPGPEVIEETYAEAFARHGLVPIEQDREEIASWITSWSRYDELLPFLEDWVYVRHFIEQREDLQESAKATKRLMDALVGIEDGSLRIWILENILIGDAEELVSIAENAELEAEDAATLNLLGFGLEELGQSANATEVWRRAQLLYPDDYVLNANLAAMLALGPYPRHYDEAVEYLRAALAARPDSITTRHWLGEVLSLAEREDEAEKVLEDARSRAPDHGGILVSLGGIYLARGDFDRAVDLGRRAVELVPEDGKVTGFLGTALWEQGNHSEAIGLMRRAVELEPGNAQMWNFLGEFLLSTGALQEAIEAFDRATTLDPSRPLYRENLARANKMKDA